MTGFSNRYLKLAAVAFVLLTLIVWRFRAQADAKPQILTIAAMPPGTSWYVFASTLAQMLESQLPPETSVEIFARGGGIGNPILVERGKAQVALSQLATAVWAWDGQDRAFHGIRHRRIRALAGGLNSVWMTAVLREQYITRTGNDTLQKALQAKPGPRIVMKPPGSTVPIVADMILEAFGSSREKVKANGGSILQISANQIPDLLTDGRADLYFETAIKGHPALTEASTTGSLRFLDFPPMLLDVLSRQGLKPRPMPVWFKGQSKPTEAVDCGTVLIVRDDLPEPLAYLITKTLCENRGVMIRAHKAWADFDPVTAGKPELTGIPLHPGAERYYREKRWL